MAKQVLHVGLTDCWCAGLVDLDCASEGMARGAVQTCESISGRGLRSATSMRRPVDSHENMEKVRLVSMLTLVKATVQNRDSGEGMPAVRGRSLERLGLGNLPRVGGQGPYVQVAKADGSGN